MHTAPITRGQLIRTLTGLSLGVLLAALDGTIVGTAMPTIIRDLKGMDLYAWPFTIYMLCSTSAIPLSGKLADIYGRKRIFITGLILFLLSSILCGLSHSMIQLILFRGAQGIGGGVLLSNAFAIIGELFPPRKIGKYIGYLIAMFGISSIVGPLLGGFITTHASWHWVFYVNIPIGIIAFFMITTGFPARVHQEHTKRYDLAGNIVFLMFLVPMLLALGLTGRGGAKSMTIVLPLALMAAVMFPLFIAVEHRAEDPMIPLSLFKKRVFTLAAAGAFLSNAVFFGSIIFLPLYLQEVLGISATGAGLSIMPMTLAFVFSSIIVGGVVSRSGKYKALYVAGFTFALAGSVLLCFLTPESTTSFVIIAVIILGIGLGITTPIFNISSQATTPQRQLGVVTSTIQLARNIGGTAGAALFGSLMHIRLSAGITGIDMKDAPEAVARISSDPSIFMNPAALSAFRETLPVDAVPFFEAIMVKIRVLLASSINAVFIAAAAVALTALIVAFFMKEIPLGERHHTPVE
jgi:EmrB/QacA subfamily drug resistance transporter